MRLFTTLFTSLVFTMGSCNNDDNSTVNNNDTSDTNVDEVVTDNSSLAKISSVTTSGKSQNYTFNVEITSPDTGCDQYADWWEVITEEGELIYRRILTHSHVTEQPFIRSGSAINVTEDQVIIIRAHMNNSGYSEQVLKGSVNTGFTENTVDKDFANELALQTPLPDGCAF